MIEAERSYVRDLIHNEAEMEFFKKLGWDLDSEVINIYDGEGDSLKEGDVNISLIRHMELPHVIVCYGDSNEIVAYDEYTELGRIVNTRGDLEIDFN